MSASTSEARLVEIGMPRLSDSMEEATILAWLKRPGDDVVRGQPLVEVETDKATMVYEAETDGVLEEIVVGEGGTAALGAVIARVRVGGPAGAPSAPPTPTPSAGTSVPAPGGEREVKVELEFREAVRQALDEELARDERVFLFGEDVAVAGGVFAVTPGLYEKYGRDRVLRHADLGARDDRRGLRGRDHRQAAGARDHVRRLPRARRWTRSSTRRRSTGS